MIGTVSNVISAKGYGFISGDNGQEYFFHKEETISNWYEIVADFAISGAGIIKVEFIPYKAPKGPRAKSVTVIED